MEKTWPPIDPWPELDQGNGRLLTLTPVLGMYALSTIPTVGTVFKDASWTEQCGVANDRTEYVTETVKASIQTFEILAAGAKMYCFSVPKTGLTSKFPSYSTHCLPIWSALPLSSVSPCPPCTRASLRTNMGQGSSVEPLKIKKHIPWSKLVWCDL